MGQLIERFRLHWPDMLSVAIGDSANDIPMFTQVDVPVLVKRHDGTHDPECLRAVESLRLADGIGPDGWRLAVESVVPGFE